jgi:multidrug efflux pump subunit AcrA (membrane-fusion protein)
MEEGTMGAWLKEVGDDVAKGDILAEIESDKVFRCDVNILLLRGLAVASRFY